METFVRNFFMGATLAFGLVLFSSSATGHFFDEKADIKKAQKDILDLAKKIEEGKDVGSDCAAIRKKYEELNTLMHSFKPSPKGGIGTGLEPKAGDGIEVKIINLGKRALSPAALTKEKSAIVKLGYINAALAEISMHYAPEKPKGGKGAKEWKAYCEEMKKASMELVEAANAGKLPAIKTAATNLNNSCNNCHSDFRDS